MNLNRSSSALAAMFLVVLFATAVCAQSGDVIVLLLTK